MLLRLITRENFSTFVRHEIWRMLSTVRNTRKFLVPRIYKVAVNPSKE